MRTETLSDNVVLHLGDCREIIHTLAGDHDMVTDPPYGINYKISARSWSNDGLDALRPWKMDARPAIEGDDTSFDVGHLLRFRKVAIFGANHMEGLPAGGRWIVWDKRRDSKPDDHSDCEFVWTNVPGADRIHRQKWRGIVREGEDCSNSRKLHPNQKPVALLSFIFDQIGATDAVIDPYMGSGSTGVVAIRRGLSFAGIESDRGHFDVACRRLAGELWNRAEAAE